MELDRGRSGAAYVTSYVWLAGRWVVVESVLSVNCFRDGKGVTFLVP